MQYPHAPFYPFPYTSPYYNSSQRQEWYKENWTNYLAETTIAKYTGDVVGSYIKEASREQIQAIQESSRLVAGVNATGFLAIGEIINAQTNQNEVHFRETYEKLNSMVALQRQIVNSQNETKQFLSEGISKLDWRLNLLNEQQNVSNVLLGDIGKLLRIPESQKERHFKIEMGLKFFRQSQTDKDFVKDAIESFVEAENMLPSDSFVLYHLGIIYLYETSVIDLEKAENYFSRSAKYSQIERDFGTNIISQNERDSFYDTDEFTAKCYYQASIACYIQNKFTKGLEYIEKSIKYSPKSKLFIFTKIKLLTALNKISDAIPLSNELLIRDPEYAQTIVNDISLIIHNEFTELIINYVNNFKVKVQNSINNIKSNIQKGSFFEKEILQLNYLSSDSPFIDYITIHSLLFKTYYFKRTDPIPIDINGTLEELVISENNYYKSIKEIVENQIQKFRKLNDDKYLKVVNDAEALIKENTVNKTLEAYALTSIKVTFETTEVIDNPNFKIIDISYKTSGKKIKIPEKTFHHYIPENNFLLLADLQNIFVLNINTGKIEKQFDHTIHKKPIQQRASEVEKSKYEIRGTLNLSSKPELLVIKKGFGITIIEIWNIKTGNCEEIYEFENEICDSRTHQILELCDYSFKSNRILFRETIAFNNMRSAVYFETVTEDMYTLPGSLEISEIGGLIFSTDDSYIYSNSGLIWEIDTEVEPENTGIYNQIYFKDQNEKVFSFRWYDVEGNEDDEGFDMIELYDPDLSKVLWGYKYEKPIIVKYDDDENFEFEIEYNHLNNILIINIIQYIEDEYERNTIYLHEFSSGQLISTTVIDKKECSGQIEPTYFITKTYLEKTLENLIMLKPDYIEILPLGKIIYEGDIDEVIEYIAFEKQINIAIDEKGIDDVANDSKKSKYAEIKPISEQNKELSTPKNSDFIVDNINTIHDLEDDEIKIYLNAIFAVYLIFFCNSPEEINYLKKKVAFNKFLESYNENSDFIKYILAEAKKCNRTELINEIYDSEKNEYKVDLEKLISKSVKIFNKRNPDEFDYFKDLLVSLSDELMDCIATKSIFGKIKYNDQDFESKIWLEMTINSIE